MKKIVLLFAFACALPAVPESVPFLPLLSPPPPSGPVFPESWSNNLELVTESVRLVSYATNLFGKCWFSEEVARLNGLGDTNGVRLVEAQWQADRDALVTRWVEAFRTNGIPVWTTNGVPVWTNGTPVLGVP